jgi:DNA-binding NarL/FixJ family response regulator
MLTAIERDCASIEWYKAQLGEWRDSNLNGVDHSAEAGGRVLEMPVMRQPAAPSAPRLLRARPAGADGTLTAREQEVAALIARGYTNRQIAEELVITPGTTANHVAHVLDKLGCRSRTQVAIRLLTSADGGLDSDAAAP